MSPKIKLTLWRWLGDARDGFVDGFVDAIALAAALVIKPAAAFGRSVRDVVGRFMRHERQFLTE